MKRRNKKEALSMEMELWFTEEQSTEEQTGNVRLSCKVDTVVYKTRSAYQDIAVIDTKQYGRMLVLDSVIQTTVADEFVYHEMISHVPLFTHPHPRKVLVVGGGDGGTVREVLKHPTVEEVILAEIDAQVVETVKRYLPETACQLDNPKVTVKYVDGIAFVQQAENEFDAILVDSPDPFGPAAGLFARDFYSAIHRALKADGIFAAQTESPFFNRNLISRVFNAVAEIFPIAKIYQANIPTYPSGYWTFTIGSKQYDPEAVEPAQIPEIATKYYTPQLHRAAFVLPRFVQDLIKKKEAPTSP